jgi:hypothetical protein
MISRPLPKPKKLTSTGKTLTTARHRAPRIAGVVHETINQLSVLNLVGYKVIFKIETGSTADVARQIEIFERSIREATLLAEQLVHCATSQQDQPAFDSSSINSEPGQTVRLLRSVPRTER